MCNAGAVDQVVGQVAKLPDISGQLAGLVPHSTLSGSFAT
jgi:hypothetical protein